MQLKLKLAENSLKVFWNQMLRLSEPNKCRCRGYIEGYMKAIRRRSEVDMKGMQNEDKALSDHLYKQTAFRHPFIKLC